MDASSDAGRQSTAGEDTKSDDAQPEPCMPNVQIATVDAFQGAEKDIILLSTVR